MGSLLSYNDGARMIIPNVPRRHAAVKIHRKKRSRTIAMNFQSSIICEIIKKICFKVFLMDVSNITGSVSCKAIDDAFF